MRRRQILSLPGLAALPTIVASAQGTVLTEVDTALGRFVIAVDTAVAPVTVANYLAYVDARHLDNGAVYRIVNPANQPADTSYKIDVVQWGMNTPDEKPSPFAPIVHETTSMTGLRHLDGTVSMARNGPGTATAEFFICVGPQPALDFGGGRNPDGQGFAAFGQVVAGREVVQAIYGKAQVRQFIEPTIAVRSVRRISSIKS